MSGLDTCFWPGCLHCPASPVGVPRGGDFSPVHLEQPVSRQEGFRGPDSVDGVRTGAAPFPWCGRVSEAGGVGGVSVAHFLACVSHTVPRPRLRRPFRWKGCSHCCSPGLSRGNTSSGLSSLLGSVSCSSAAGGSLGQVWLLGWMASQGVSSSRYSSAMDSFSGAWGGQVGRVIVCACFSFVKTRHLCT